MTSIAAPTELSAGDERSETLKLLLLIVFAFVLTAGWNLTLQAISNPDEPRYAAPARQMLDGGDWMVPIYNTNPRLMKPILFYWLIAITGKIGEVIGLGIVAGMRLTPFLAGLAGAIGIFFIGKRLYNARCGFFAAIVLMTTRFYHEISRQLVVDMTLTAFCIWGLLFSLYALDRIKRKESATAPLLGMYLCLGLASMTKGPLLALMFVALPVLLYMKWDKRIGDLRHFGAGWGVPLFLVVGLWWFLLIHLSGHDMIQFFKTENVGRALGAKDHQRYWPFLFYLNNLCENALPWVIALPFTAYWSWRQWRGREGKPPAEPDALSGSPDTTTAGSAGASPSRISSESKFLFCAIAVPFFLLGLSISKRALYILPLYPLISLWIAHAWDEAFLAKEGQTFCGKCANVLGGMIVMACLGGIYALPWLEQKAGAHMPELITAGVLLGGIALCAWSASQNLKHGYRYRASMLLLAIAACIALGYEAIRLPILERDTDSVNFFRQVCERLNGRKVVLLGESANEAVWFLNRPQEFIDNLRYPDLRPRFFDSPGTVLITTEHELEKSKLGEAIVIESTLRRGTGDDIYVFAHPNPDVTPDPSIFEKRSRHVVRKPVVDSEGD